MNKRIPELKQKHIDTIFVAIAEIRRDQKEGRISTADVVEILQKYYEYSEKLIQLIKQDA
jgi:hypothetical protein